MAQPVQVLNGTPDNSYEVIDNGAPGNGGVAGGIGYDNCLNGAVAQGKNTFKNGTIPDAIASAPVTVTPAAALNPNLSKILFKNPA